MIKDQKMIARMNVYSIDGCVPRYDSAEKIRAYIETVERVQPVSLFLEEIAYNPDADVVDCLLDHNIDMNSYAGAEPYWFHFVSNTPNPEAIAKIIKSGVNVSLFDLDSERNALHIAARRGNRRICEILLDAGICIHSRTRGSAQAIHIAARSGNAETVELLLSRGANHSSRTANGMVPLSMCPSLFIEEQGGVVAHLVRAGADINGTCGDGNTAVHYAVAAESAQRLFHLIVHGADVNRQNASGKAAWQFRDGSPVYGKLRTMSRLYMAGASISMWTPGEYDGVSMSERLMLDNIAAHLAGLPLHDTSHLSQRQIEIFDNFCLDIIRAHSDDIASVCIALHNLRLPALVLCEVVHEIYSCWQRLRFCDVWDRVVAVRHFHERRSKK